MDGFCVVWPRMNADEYRFVSVLSVNYFDEDFDEARRDRGFLAAGWSLVRSTILLFRIT
jgi:hypothetical protein